MIVDRIHRACHRSTAVQMPQPRKKAALHHTSGPYPDQSPPSMARGRTTRISHAGTPAPSRERMVPIRELMLGCPIPIPL